MDDLDIVQSATDKQTHYLRLILSDQIILVTLNQIHMMLPILELQTIPQDDPALAGMLNYHGQPVPVYHLFKLIKTKQHEYNLNTLILMSSLPQGLISFLTCEEIDIVNISPPEIKATINNHRPYVIGLVENEKWSAWVLDLEKLLKLHKADKIPHD